MGLANPSPAVRAGGLALAGRKARASLPALPLLGFLLVFFLAPLVTVFSQAVVDYRIADALPTTLAALENWDGEAAPPAAAYDALAADFKVLHQTRQTGALAQRLSFEVVGGQPLVNRTVRMVSRAEEGTDWRGAFLEADAAWGQPELWRILRDGGQPVTTLYLRWSVGLLEKYDPSGGAAVAGYDFPAILARTLTISLTVTLITILLGYPVAYAIAENENALGRLVFLAVLLPFWTSLLVRSMSWVVLLQGNGELVALLRGLGFLGPDEQLLYSRTASILAMTQIQLPFTILPMIGVMRSIPKSQVRAARSLGAGPLRAHWSVYLPQAVPGIAAGATITFILCLGFYITPALVGGAGDQMISFFVARFTNEELNWNLAAALSVVLLAVTAVVIWLVARFVNLRALSGRRT